MRDNDSDVTEFIQSGSIHEHAKRQLHLFQTIDTCKQSEVHIEFARSRPAHAQSRSIDIELLGRKRSLGILLGKHHVFLSGLPPQKIRAAAKVVYQEFDREPISRNLDLG